MHDGSTKSYTRPYLYFIIMEMEGSCCCWFSSFRSCCVCGVCIYFILCLMLMMTSFVSSFRSSFTVVTGAMQQQLRGTLALLAKIKLRACVCVCVCLISLCVCVRMFGAKRRLRWWCGKWEKHHANRGASKKTTTATGKPLSSVIFILWCFGEWRLAELGALAMWTGGGSDNAAEASFSK